MKKFSILGGSLLASMVIAVMVFFNACTDDPCKDVNCLNGGNCVDGTCVCATGYEGTDCSTEMREKFLGTYLLSGTDNMGNTYTNISTTIGASSSAVNKIVITIAGSYTIPATLNSSTSFTIDPTTHSGFNFSGSGSINGTTLSVTINQEAGGVTTIFTWSGNKQ